MSAIDRLLGKGTVTYHIAIADALDSLSAAIFAEQIAFWQDKSEDGWAFRSTEQIQEYTGLKRRKQEAARKTLKSHGVLQEERRGMPARLFYRIDLEILQSVIVQKDNQGCTKIQSSLYDRTNRSIEGVKREKESTPEGNSATPEASPAFSADHYVGLIAEELEFADVPLLPARKSRYGKEFKKLLDKNIPEPVMYKVVDRIVERWLDDNDHFKLTAEQALGDVNNGRKKTGSGSNPQAGAGRKMRDF